MEGQLHAIPASSVPSSQPKSTILKKGKPKPKKGLGVKKKGGLGAQKVNAINFDDLEKDAELADKAKSRLSISSSTSDKSANDENRATNMRLAYKDLELQKKQQEKVMSSMDDKKRQQANRLGMGVGKTGGVSHGLTITAIEQDNPDTRRGRYQDDDEDIFYDTNPKSKRSWNKWDQSDEDDDYMDKLSNKTGFKPPPTYTITPLEEGHRPDRSMIIKNIPETNERMRKPERKTNIPEPDLQKYRDDSNTASNSDWQRFEGRTFISSDDFRDTSQPYTNDSSFRDGVKEGVRSVAGKLSSMASDIAGSIQDRYGK